MKVEWTRNGKNSFQGIVDPAAQIEIRRVIRRIEAGDPDFAFDLSLGAISYLNRHEVGAVAYLVAIEGTYRFGSDHVVLTRVGAVLTP